MHNGRDISRSLHMRVRVQPSSTTRPGHPLDPFSILTRTLHPTVNESILKVSDSRVSLHSVLHLRCLPVLSRVAAARCG